VAGVGSSAVANAASGPVQSVPRPTSISCLSGSWCMVAGAKAGRRFPFSGIWQGGTFRELVTARPAHPGTLSGVSCTSRSNCMAVGGGRFINPFAETWNGRRWRLLAVDPGPMMQAVSCPTSGFCMAVGHTSQAASESWNGSAWTVLPTPTTAGAVSSRLTGVACVSPVSCIAVGFYTATVRGPLLTLAEQWNGVTWQVLDTTGIGQGSAHLIDVSCASAALCVAVGGVSANVTDSVTALAAAWNGHSWRVLPVAAPLGAIRAVLDGVSCPGKGGCMAVGSYQPAKGNQVRALAERWRGKGWQLLAAPSPFTRENDLAAVSCSAAASCRAVGSASALRIPPGYAVLGEAWNGRTWAALRLIKNAALAGVSCTSSTACLAVGGYLNRSDRGSTLSEQWNGAAWRQRATRTPVPLDELTDVSCVGAAFCMAVGSNGVNRDVAEAWNGARWRLLRTPPYRGLISVSCVSARFCMAVGLHEGDATTSAEKWNGTRWTVTPTPALFGGGTLTGVSCVSRTWCLAVGQRRFTFALAEIWNGRRWRSFLGQSPGAGNAFTSVACTARNRCMAVGHYFSNTPFVSLSMAQRWNGKAWKVLTMPGHGGLLDISCPRASSCVAVGHYLNPRGNISTDLAERWNGSVWRIITPTKTGGGLAAVSCVGSGRCVAVGQAGSLALAELWTGARWLRLRAKNP